MSEIRRAKYAGTLNTDIKTIEGGDWVLVRARVMPDGDTSSGRRVRLLSISGYQQITVNNNEIICHIDSPIPEEPHLTSLLVSKKDAVATMWSKGRGDRYWRRVGSVSDELLWSELYTAYGPFEEYKSAGTIT
jgi:hypothetical protein